MVILDYRATLRSSRPCLVKKISQYRSFQKHLWADGGVKEWFCSSCTSQRSRILPSLFSLLCLQDRASYNSVAEDDIELLVLLPPPLKCRSHYTRFSNTRDQMSGFCFLPTELPLHSHFFLFIILYPILGQQEDIKASLFLPFNDLRVNSPYIGVIQSVSPIVTRVLHLSLRAVCGANCPALNSKLNTSVDTHQSLHRVSAGKTLS